MCHGQSLLEMGPSYYYVTQSNIDHWSDCMFHWNTAASMSGRATWWCVGRVILLTTTLTHSLRLIIAWRYRGDVIIIYIIDESIGVRHFVIEDCSASIDVAPPRTFMGHVTRLWRHHFITVGLFLYYARDFTYSCPCTVYNIRYFNLSKSCWSLMRSCSLGEPLDSSWMRWCMS